MFSCAANKILILRRSLGSEKHAGQFSVMIGKLFHFAHRFVCNSRMYTKGRMMVRSSSLNKRQIMQCANNVDVRCQRLSCRNHVYEK